MTQWSQVQELLSSRAVKGEKFRTHNHYLKSSVLCGQCGSRLIVSLNTNRHGTTYPYFVCVGRHQKRTACTQRALRIETVEARVERLYDSYSLSATLASQLETYLKAEFALIQSGRCNDRDQLSRARRRIEDEQTKLLQAHYADAIPLELMKREQSLSRVG